MKLKKIVLHGFKSFVERTVVEFSDGVTGIVGPNGCGKSNIVDAFRWVFGEQSAKSLRGEKMLDVIFSGTAKRKAHAFAEVTLYFTDVGDALPVSYDEVTVCRRLTRDGKSEYKLNGQPARMRDIQSLFWDSGLGKDAFGIIEQGKIDEVVLCSPEDRRPIFDQAAGILRFRQRRKEAMRKLVQTEQNLVRGGDILKEVAAQAETLQRQRKEAQAYQGQKERLEKLERGQLATRWRAAQASCQKIEAEQASAEPISDEAVQAATEHFYQLRTERDLQARDLQSLHQRLTEREARRNRAAKEQAELESVEKELGEQIAQLKREHKEQPLAAAKKSWEKEQQAHEKAQAKVESLRAKQRETQGERAHLSDAALQATRALHEGRLALETAEQRLGHLEQKAQDLAEELDTLHIDAKAKLVAEATAEAEEQKRELELTQKQLQAKREAREAAQKEIEKIASEITDMRARERVLTSLRDSLDGFSSSAKRLLKESPVALEALSSEMALMHPYDHTLVVENAKDCDKLVAFAKEQNLRDFSIAVRTQLKKLRDEVDTSADFYLDKLGVLFFPSSVEKSPFLREAELKGLAKGLKERDRRRKVLESELGKYSSAVQKLTAKQGELEHHLRRQEMKLVELNFALQQQKASRLEKEKQQDEQKLELTELKKRVATLRRDVERSALLEEKARKSAHAHEEQFAAMDEALEAQLSLLRERAVELQVAERHFRSCEAQVSRLASALQMAEVKLTDARARRAQLSTSGKEEKQEERDLTKRKTETERALVRLERELGPAQKAAEKIASDFEKWKEKTQRAEISFAQKRATMERLAAEAQERFSTDVAELEAIDADDGEIRSLRRAVESAQNINLAAIDEYEGVHARAAELEAQVTDLETGRLELLEIIGDLDNSSREQFVVTFDQIRTNFQKHFQVLFQGGEADLVYVDSNDPLMAGIDIIAKPPGKKMRSITLLSGGEKCLTAMALLFAIFEVQPAPFCILDEMDAPLDDANIGRFLAVLNPFMHKTQFIIVTHNKRTMAVADKLFGVSMQERGVSKLLSLEFQKVLP